MSRGMNNMPTYRQGRTRYTPGAKDRGGCSGVCSGIFLALLLAAPPLVLIGSETVRRGRFLTLREALDSDVVDLNDVDLARAMNSNPVANGPALFPSDSLVHGTSSDIDTVATDAANRISLPGALTLRRETEYCQWQEMRSQRCQTCHRSGSSKQKSYQCNCVTDYSYIKSWKSHRVNSFLFDQPAAHHNPQRDPMPSTTFAAEGAQLVFDEHAGENHHHRRNDDASALRAVLDPSMLSSVRNQPWRSVDFVHAGRAPPPSFFASFIPASWLPVDRTRYEPISMLRDTPHSDAAVRDNFAFVGQGGYFFSPYETTTASSVMNWFVQYLEGSLFDWQLGDLMPSCTAGDVRFRYRVQDPMTVSVMGRVSSPAFATDVLRITPRRMAHEGGNENTLGLVHAGVHSPEDMLLAEDSDSRWRALFPRLLMLPWAIAASRLVGASLHRDMSSSTIPVQVMAGLGLWAFFVGGAWVVVWGLALHGRDTLFLVFTGGILSYMGYRSAFRSVGLSGSLTAVWCMFGRWANVPPEWRVEDSYRPVAVGGGSQYETSGGHAKSF